MIGSTEILIDEDKTGARIENIPIENLQPHPHNPRLALREDVVEVIRIQIKEHGFGPEHALLVRPVNGHLEILSGHQRLEAAKRAGFGAVPCWIRQMDDETALMQLVLSNAQGELAPLEIGVHALTVVGKQSGGGRKGGYAQYARDLARKDHTGIVKLAQGAEVFQAVRGSVTCITDLLDKAYHLAAIHVADRRAWPALVEAMLKGEWSAKDTADHWVPQIQKFEIPERWESVFLPYEKVITHFLKTKEFAPTTVKRLCAMADATIAMIEEMTQDDNVDPV